jgi:prepilin-type N-terminal cleavage/methylation domain-containing protein
MNRQRRAQAGFTLMELMLAVGLLALILVTLASSFGAVAHSKVHAEDRMVTEQDGRAIMWQLSKELRGAVQTPLEASKVLMIGQARRQNRLALDAITFSTLDAGHRRAIGSFAPEDTVVYELSPSPAQRGWSLLTRTQYSSLLSPSRALQGAIPVILADNVLSLHLRYFDGSRWNESWNSGSSTSGQPLPLAIMIDLAMAAPGGHTSYFSSEVAIPMAFGVR